MVNADSANKAYFREKNVISQEERTTNDPMRSRLTKKVHALCLRLSHDEICKRPGGRGGTKSRLH